MTDVNELEHYNHNNHNQGHLHIADILLTAGADVNQQCCQGASPLAVSAQVIIGVVLMTKNMIIGSHDVDDENGDKKIIFEYPYFQEGHMSVLSLLLAHGADPTLQDHHGRDPYRVALRNNNAAVAGENDEL